MHPILRVCKTTDIFLSLLVKLVSSQQLINTLLGQIPNALVNNINATMLSLGEKSSIGFCMTPTLRF